MSLSLALVPQSRNTAPRFARLRSVLRGIANRIANKPAAALFLFAFVGLLAFALVALAAVITHIVWCIKAGAWLYLFAGLIPFVSFVHGIMIWTGNA